MSTQFVYWSNSFISLTKFHKSEHFYTWILSANTSWYLIYECYKQSNLWSLTFFLFAFKGEIASDKLKFCFTYFTPALKHPPALCKLTSRKNVNSLISFVFATEQNSIVCMDHIFLIHSSVDEHWGCFYFLAIVREAAMTTFMESCSLVGYGTLWVHTQQWYVTGAYGSSSFSVSIVGELIYTPTSSK